MNQTTITHKAVEVWDQDWIIELFESGVHVEVDGYYEVAVDYRDIDNVELLVSLFGGMRVTAFHGLVKELARIKGELK